MYGVPVNTCMFIWHPGLLPCSAGPGTTCCGWAEKLGQKSALRAGPLDRGLAVHLETNVTGRADLSHRAKRADRLRSLKLGPCVSTSDSVHCWQDGHAAAIHVSYIWVPQFFFSCRSPVHLLPPKVESSPVSTSAPLLAPESAGQIPSPPLPPAPVPRRDRALPSLHPGLRYHPLLPPLTPSWSGVPCPSADYADSGSDARDQSSSFAATACPPSFRN